MDIKLFHGQVGGMFLCKAEELGWKGMGKMIGNELYKVPESVSLATNYFL